MIFRVALIACASALVLAFQDGASTPATWPVKFTDVAAKAGLTHATVYGGVDKKRFIIETNGAGVALVDVDRDGWLDALTLSGTRLQEGARRNAEYGNADAPTNRLYRNKKDGTFE